jgi:acyl carrier protein
VNGDQTQPDGDDDDERKAMTTREVVAAFVRSAFGQPDLSEAADIFESGLVESIFAMELISFVETTFAIEVEYEDLDVANFASIDRISELVDRKLATR